jgi:hypothetical protein
MKKQFFLIAIFIAAGIILNSCKKDDEETARPVINLLELGEGDTHGNDHTAKVGGECHIEAEITAEGTISLVTVKIHHENGHGKGILDDGWELDTTYTKFSGLKNTLFHEHVEIDSTAEPGEYHFDMIVVDQEGYQTSVESDLLIIEE